MEQQKKGKRLLIKYIKLRDYKYINQKEFRPTVISRWGSPNYAPSASLCSIIHDESGMTLNLFIGSVEDFNTHCKNKYDKELVKRSYQALFFSNESEGTTIYWIHLLKNEFLAEDYNSIVHELHHFIHYALSDRNQPYHLDYTEEKYALMQGWFMEMVIRALVELNRIKKKK